MEDFTVKLVSAKHVPLVNVNGGVQTITRVTITVGPYGPFSKEFTPPNDTPEDINAWKMMTANSVRSIAG